MCRTSQPKQPEQAVSRAPRPCKPKPEKPDFDCSTAQCGFNITGFNTSCCRVQELHASATRPASTTEGLAFLEVPASAKSQLPKAEAARTAMLSDACQLSQLAFVNELTSVFEVGPLMRASHALPGPG